MGCPIDCKLSGWSAWNACTKTCAGGTKRRTKSVMTKTQYGGVACGLDIHYASCNHFQCPIDCKLSGWSAFTACSATCASGTKKRTKSVITAAAYGGAACTIIKSIKTCNTFACPIDCRVTMWTAFTTCTKTCATGTKKRARSIVNAPLHGGVVCPMLKEYKTCNTFACPIDCKVSRWTKFGACTKTCGTGTKKRSRSIVNAPLHGGKACVALKSSKTCNTFACPVDCKVSRWTAWGTCSEN